MSQISYTAKPDFIGDSALSRTGYAAANIFASRHGWIAPAAGMGFKVPSAISGTAGTVTVTSVAHGLVSGNESIITGVSVAAYNGFTGPITVTTADAFTYLNAATAVATVAGARIYKTFEVLAAIGELGAVSADALTAPTYTAALVWASPVFTATITPSEAVYVSGKPTLALNITAGIRSMVYDAASSTNTLVFKYTAVAADNQASATVTTGTTTIGAFVSDVLPSNKSQRSTVAFTAGSAVTVVIAL